MSFTELKIFSAAAKIAMIYTIKNLLESRKKSTPMGLTIGHTNIPKSQILSRKNFATV